MSRDRLIRTVLRCLVAIICFVGPARGTADAQQTPIHVRLAAAPVDDVAPVLYAQAQGWFRQAGLDVDITPLTTGAAIAAAVAGGSVDIGMSSTLPLISAHVRGVPLVLVAPSGLFEGSQQPNGAIVVAKDSLVHGARDLNGKVVSVPALYDLFAIATRAWIDKNGGDPQTISFVEVAGPIVPAALDAGRIAAGTISNPSMAQALATGRYRLLSAVLPAIGPRFLTAVWFSSKDFVAKNPDTIQKFAAVVRRASAYCNEHPDRTTDLVAKFTGIDASIIAHMTRPTYATRLDARDLQPLIDAAAKYKAIVNRFDAHDMIDPDVIK